MKLAKSSSLKAKSEGNIEKQALTKKDEVRGATIWLPHPKNVIVDYVDIFTRVRKLNLPEKLYVVIGSGTLEIKGIRIADDVDIMITSGIFQDLRKRGGWNYIKKTGLFGDVMELLQKDDVQLYYHIYGKCGYDFFMRDASRVEVHQGMYFASLSDLLRAKKEWGRTKDIADVKLIEQYLQNGNQ